MAGSFWPALVSLQLGDAEPGEDTGRFAAIRLAFVEHGPHAFGPEPFGRKDLRRLRQAGHVPHRPHGSDGACFAAGSAVRCDAPARIQRTKRTHVRRLRRCIRDSLKQSSRTAGRAYVGRQAKAATSHDPAVFHTKSWASRTPGDCVGRGGRVPWGQYFNPPSPPPRRIAPCLDSVPR